MSQTKPLQPWRNRPNPYQGTPGPQGPPGEDGAEWLSVSGVPAGSLGSVGDWALDAATGQVWQKTGSATWTSRGSLRGPQGVQGETGPAGTITGASATGLAAGASPTVTLGGSPSARTFAFGIPRGATGATGAKGETGDTGPKGDQGDTGPPGAAATVSVGSTTTGAPGTNASVTQGGTPQARTFSFTIPRGATGAKGDKGDPGGAGVLGGGKGIHPAPQSIPNATWTVVSRAGSGQSWFYIGDGGVTVFSGFQMHCRVDSAGWWMVGASLCWDGNSSGRRIMAVETWTGTDPGVNQGTRIIGVEQVSSNGWTAQNASTVAYLEANTNVRLYCYQNSGGSLSTNMSAPTELWLTRIL